jgi:glycosyltransferase involved in cell wall biosynthesis
MKNVLSIVSYQFLPAKMGGQKGIAFFNRFFSKQVKLTCVTVERNDPQLAEGYDLLNILSDNKIRYINFLYFFTLKKIIKERNITHVVLEHPYYGWLGILLKIFCKIKLIVHSHNIESERFKSTGKWWWKILRFYEKLTYKSADICFFISDEDKDYAIRYFDLEKQKCTTITYGFELSNAPLQEEKKIARDFLHSKYAIDHQDKLLLFNGTLNYKPNLDAINIIIKKINPLLLSNNSFRYKIIICGKGLPDSYAELSRYKNENIIYAGFVDDIVPYFKGSDIFINPVVDGGGIKTKLVESLGYNMNVVTTANGAIGVPVSITGNKMKIVANDDWKLFAEDIIMADIHSNIPAIYFDHFYWEAIAKKALNMLSDQ